MPKISKDIFEDLAKIYKECKDLRPTELIRRFESYTIFLADSANLGSPCYSDIMSECMVIKDIIRERLRELERLKLREKMEGKECQKYQKSPTI